METKYVFEDTDFRNIELGDLQYQLNLFIYMNDRKASLFLIKYIHECFESGNNPSNDILQKFIMHAFRDAVEKNLTLDQAFKLKLGKGRYNRNIPLFRNWEAALRVTLLMRTGKRYLDAIGDVANILFEDGKGDKAVKKAYEELKSFIESYSNEEIDEMIAEAVLDRS